MAYPLGTGELSTLRASAHWHCDLYKITRPRGGMPVCVSTLDRKFTYLGNTYTPTAGQKSDEQADSGMAAGNTELIGVMGPQTMTLADVQRGVFDDARVDQYVVDWRRRKCYRHNVWWIDEVNQDGILWRATLTSMARFLEQIHGSIYQGTCTAVLGDSKCGATVTEDAGTVTSVVESNLEFGSGVGGLTNRFALGTVTWTGGNNTGRPTRVQAFASGTFALAEPTRFAIRVGDTFNARPGCDGRAITCKVSFSNLANYRGNERQGNSKQLILSRGTIE